MSRTYACKPACHLLVSEPNEPYMTLEEINDEVHKAREANEHSR